MTAIELGFKAFDPHELLCHFVAHSAGLYKKENLQVILRDITFVPEDELPTNSFQASCGAALSSALKGLPQRIVLVATDKPMFWIVSSSRVKELSELSGTTIATFPDHAPPHHLANMILTKAGAKPLNLQPARDDIARLGLLKSHSVDAAVISSSIAPPVIEAAGFNILCIFGEEIRVPTTGLAIDQSFLEQETTLCQTLVDIHKTSLKLIQEDVELVSKVLEEYFNVPHALAGKTASLYQPYYTKDGKTTAEIAQNAINSISRSLDISNEINWQDIYQF